MNNKNTLITTAIILLMTVITLSCSKSDDSDVVDDTPTSITKDFKGNYVGTWNSVTPSITYVDYLISMRINSAPTSGNTTTLFGEFFATSNSKSCCGNTNDGTLTIKLNDTDNTIESFTFNDQVEGCTGNFSGSGTYTGSSTTSTPKVLTIDFTGSDCDGNHIGKMKFTKIIK